MQITPTARWSAPWYVHPAVEPEAWRAMLAGHTGIGFAVVNVNSGLPWRRDPYYGEVLRGRGPATPLLVGYVNADYGNRRAGAVLREAARWRERHGITAVMLDCVPTQLHQKHWSLDLIDELRTDGAEFVVANPGVHCHPDLVLSADVTCVIETDYAAYLDYAPTPDLAEVPAGRQWHLVHGVPAAAQAGLAEVAAAKGGGHIWATSGVMPDPWSVLPDHLRSGREPTAV